MTSSPGGIQDRNIAAIFNVLDANGSGVITEEDFDLIGRRICAQLGIDADSDTGARIRDPYLSWWKQLRSDLDSSNDNEITLAEFAALHKGGRGDPQAYFGEHLAQAAKVAAEVIDTDGDGYIEEDEYLRLLAVGVSDPQVARAGFRKLDTDSDGRISIEEFQLGVRDMFLSDDPAAPGTSMLG